MSLTSSLQKCIVLRAQSARNIAQSYCVASWVCVPRCSALLKVLFLALIPPLDMLRSLSLVFHRNKGPDVPCYVAGCFTRGISCLRPPDSHFFTYRSYVLGLRPYNDYLNMVTTNFRFSQKGSFWHCLNLFSLLSTTVL